MIKQVQTCNFSEGRPFGFYSNSPPRLGYFSQQGLLEINTNQIVSSTLCEPREYIYNCTSQVIKSKFLWVFNTEDIKYTPIYSNTPEYYLTTFSDGSIIRTLEKLIGEEL